jgi:tetratricopeptide (TPR) repeat protein
MKNQIFLIMGLLLILTGCASEIQKRTSDRYTLIGIQAQARGDWDTARRAYARAVVNAEQAKLPAKNRAIRTYEYGRALGVTCFFDLAELELNSAYDLDKQAGQPLYLSLTELARLMLNQKKYQQAIGYFERTLKELNSANAQQVSPIVYADILDEYAQALTGVNSFEEAVAAKNSASEIREKNPNRRSITDRTPYGKFCTKQ